MNYSKYIIFHLLHLLSALRRNTAMLQLRLKECFYRELLAYFAILRSYDVIFSFVVVLIS